MITIEQRIELLKGGYTPEQIAAFEQQTPEPTPATPEPTPATPEPTPATPEPTPAAPAAPAAPATPAIDLAQVLESNRQIMDNIGKLTAALQANAIATAVQPGGTPVPYSGDQAIAEIIAPPRKEVK